MKKKFSKEDIRHLIRFLDYSFALSKSLELEFKEITHKIEEEQHMAYLSTFERDAMNEGEQKGFQKATYKIALKLLKTKLLSTNQIMKITGLTEKEIQVLQTQIH